MGALGLGMPLPATASPVAVLQNDTPSKFATGVVVDKRTGETMPGAAVAVWQQRAGVYRHPRQRGHHPER